MNNHSDVATLYKAVIDDVIGNVKNDFLNTGVDEQVLFELQELWESKLVESKVLSNLEFPSNLGIQQTSMLHRIDNLSLFNPNSPQGLANMVPIHKIPSLTPNYGSYGPGTAANLANLANSSYDLQTLNYNHLQYQYSNIGRPSPYLPNGQPRISPSKTKEPPGQMDGTVNDDDTYLGSDLDDEDDNDGFFEGENLILCQYEKVTRSKSQHDKLSRTRIKWKCILRDGIMHVNGTDYAFNRVMAEFEWG